MSIPPTGENKQDVVEIATSCSRPAEVRKHEADSDFPWRVSRSDRFVRITKAPESLTHVRANAVKYETLFVTHCPQKL